MVAIAGMSLHREALERQLQTVEGAAALLTVGTSEVDLAIGEVPPLLEAFRTSHELGLPPARLPIDHQSPLEDIREIALPRVIAAQARRDDAVSVADLCARIVPSWALLTHAAQQDLERRMKQVAADIATGLPGLRYEAATPQTRARIRILSSPADLRPQGRTQSWQARRRAAGQLLGRGVSAPSPEQLSLDDLASEGGVGED